MLKVRRFASRFNTPDVDSFGVRKRILPIHREDELFIYADMLKVRPDLSGLVSALHLYNLY
ncbi:MAG: hypothetical protein J7J77_01090 [Candidatus Cloacimonetes bacterium]|nr:hypothetical protein [Candidatus Cloacimonadota bacterium]